ncbi:MAG: hypothetical protein FWC18_05970 [Cystobacterineae bacterium]|nr:hypothetical protein [Cystobacterineae bacterium]
MLKFFLLKGVLLVFSNFATCLRGEKVGTGEKAAVFRLFWVALGVAFASLACDSVPSSGFEPKLSVSVTELVFDSGEAGEKSFELVSNTHWATRCITEKAWCHVEPVSGSGNQTVTVRVSENSSNAERLATVVLKAGSASAEVGVRQGLVLESGCGPSCQQLEPSCAANEEVCGTECCDNATAFCDTNTHACQALLPPQPQLTRAQFSDDCRFIELLGEPGIQPPAVYASSTGTLSTLCPGGVSGSDSGFRCPLSADQFVPGTHSAQWTVGDDRGGESSTSAYAFQTTLANTSLLPMELVMPSAVLGRDAMEGRQPMRSQTLGTPHASGSCWGGTTPLRGSIAAGPCALQANGTVRCWGSNTYGQATVPENLNAVAIVGGEIYNCALQADSTVRCWGDNSIAGQTTVPANLNAIAIAAGS